MKQRSRPLLGTFVEISVPTNSAPECLDKAFEGIAFIESVLSFFNHESDVSRINALSPNTPLTIHPHTYRVLSFAQELSRHSNGIFDVTVGNTLAQKGFLPQKDYLMYDGKWSDIVLGEDSSILLTKRVCIDLGGIAKGYAVDCAIQVLREYGITYGSVNAGGDLRVFGSTPESLIVRHPITPTQTIYLGELLHNNAAATSAGYYSRTNESLPIVHPHRSQCINSYESVTILAPTCMIADSLTKVFLIDPHNSHPLLSHYNARVFLLRYDEEQKILNVFDSKVS
ncbi:MULTISPECIES: FAD:protein FMN transferase [unclassified Sulfuricurvum]|uniref:FAD:protein FMN transferase n=1 Tax=unclassified Sulfuricurvum TaxID=2632390 RepID=UPI0002999869|nr:MULTISPECIES: FAD:protein FMN transferase [unclassified Sulfuricurvum]AFV96864.1 hypothetical protein B649_02750 [Candidatus Sulfuricurvum sp. RIFRC-1]HBM35806.1 FAD:protein FMN transferase [Sulfuricurvum sp.]